MHEEVRADAADGDTPPPALLNKHGLPAPLVEARAPGGDSIGNAFIEAFRDAAQGAPALLGLGTNCGSGVSVD